MDRNLINLPDLCWFAIFKRLPTVDALLINGVCRRLNVLQAHYFFTKKSLQIEFIRKSRCEGFKDNFCITKNKFDLTANFQDTIDPNDENDDEPDDDQPFQGNLKKFAPKSDLKLNPANLSNIANKFPNIKKLTLLDHRSRSLALFDQVLQYWPEVTHLAIIVYSWTDAGAVIEALNQLGSLKYLSLNCEIDMLPQLLSIREQLHEFYCCYSDVSGDVSYRDSVGDMCHLADFASSKNVGVYISNSTSNNHILSLPFSSQFTRLGIDIKSISEVATIGRKFRMLSYLNLFVEESAVCKTLTDYLTLLTSLKNLTYLKITSESGMILPNADQLSQLCQLETVTQVKFQFYIAAHSVDWIKIIFPNAEQIWLEIRDNYQKEFHASLCDKQSCSACKYLKEEYAQAPELFDCSVEYDLSLFEYIIKDVSPPLYLTEPN